MYGRGGLKGTFEGKGASDRFVKRFVSGHRFSDVVTDPLERGLAAGGHPATAEAEGQRCFVGVPEGKP